ncbi:MAG: SAM-dependent methyltransferase [Proteobacteria bacterium]|nr:SAM-dependent methyltransferase [Pseudomonadota bacterium]
MTPLAQIIRKKIETEGPISVGTFMELALGHPEYGYYRTRDPLGRSGDFTTAPEISQIFGELLGLWVADMWMQMGSPPRFSFVEIGPGRGTLMADAMRATRKIKGFHDAARIVLVETSPVLTEKQKKTLVSYDVLWADSIDNPAVENGEGPIILLANEFLDTLSLRQLQLYRNEWYERVVVNKEAGFAFDVSNQVYDSEIAAYGATDGAIFETSPEREAFIRNLSGLIHVRGGAALLIDYGHDRAGLGETLQAIRAHRFVSVLEDVGENDVTSHVDFSALARVAKLADMYIYGPAGQGVFLESLGIRQRAEMLMWGKPPVQQKEIVEGMRRLTHSAQMGQLFRVMALCHDVNLRPAGF